MSIREDLRFVQDSLKMIIYYIDNNKDVSDTLKKALWHSIIISYGRCFTDSSKAKLGKLEIREYFKESDEKLRLTHELLMDLRHNFIAHRGITDNEVSVVYFKIPIKSKDKTSTEYRIKTVRSILPNIVQLREIESCVIHLIEIVEQKIKMQTEKVHKMILSEFTPEMINKFLINNIDLTK
ncbi:MAG: hypothetical protein A2046_12285 [Bacteroidetes bacterium GWA2_30_7]|nr:MAG: hypothetical protein A2046_12285 [Bacteroidetes bacterium GWA2_30_7]